MDKIMKINFIVFISLLGQYQVKGFEKPRISEHPKDTIVPRHDPATLNCKAEGFPNPSINWYKDNKLLKIEANGNRLLLPGGGLFFLKVVHSRKDSDAGIYFCEAKNEFGAIRSSPATLQVAVLKDEFRKEPQNTQKAQGDTVVLECSPPKGLPDPNVIWKKNGQRIEMDGSKRVRVVDFGNLVIQEVRQSDEGQYQCVARNLAGIRESSQAFLKVHVKPELIRGPQNQTVVEGSTVTFQCRVQGDPIPDILWIRSASGGNMPLDRVHILEDRSLRLENVTLEDTGEYSCEADNKVGIITATGVLNVHTLPTLSIKPTPKVIEAPSEVSFECKAVAQPNPVLFWSIEGNNTLIFPPNRFDRFETTVTPEGSSILTIPSTTKSDNDLVIICNAVNDVGSVSVRVKLTVNSITGRPPPIIIYGPSNQTLPVKSVATLPCRATGDPKPIISWYLDGNPILNSERTNITSSGSLVISDLDKNLHSGQYFCVASSKTGKSTWSAFLRLDSPTNPNIKFYRAPEVQAFPSAPGKPQITNVTEKSITISWSPSIKSGQSDIIGYTIEVFFTDNSKGWVIIAQQLQATTYTYKTVDKDYAYMFIVRAENELGLGPPSQISEAVSIGKELSIESDINFSEAYATLTSSNIVVLLEANSTDSTSVRLVWEIQNGKFVEGFYIYSRKVNFNDANTYKILTVLHGGGSSSCTVSNLDKFTFYDFFLIPFYKNIEGKPSNSKQTYTQESVPTAAPTKMEAILINSSSVFIKWQAPPNDSMNGILKNYDVVIRGYDANNMSRILTNMTVDNDSPKILLTNLSSGVTYSVSVAAATSKGLGPYSVPSMLRLDPNTKKLDLGYTRYPIQRDYSDDIITQTWFIILLGSIIAISVFLFCATVIFKRIQYMKHNSLTSVHGNVAVGTVRKFPTLPLNENGVFIDHTGGIWRQASEVGNLSGSSCLKDISDYAQVPLPDYERLSPMTMPDYAEVTGCSSFKSLNSPKYETYGAYATTSLVQNNSRNNKNTYSAPNSIHYTNYLNSQQLQSDQVKIYENKLENLLNLNNLNSPSAITQASNSQIQLTDPVSRNSPKFGTIRRNKHKSKNSSKNSINNLTGDDIEQPLCIKSSNSNWSTPPLTNSINEFSYQNSFSNNYPLQNAVENNHKNNSQIYLSSFGKIDKV